ncbi:MAG: PorP/SprF family type IX secretion system membrane protein [Bacteroidetes bacterium]|nr:PorP/SprF family type IX secretion system membrane protein [Bacteroidota bacterium]
MKTFTLLRNSFLGAVLLSVTVASAQDIHFSQFDQSPLTLNPGLAGTTTWLRAAMMYRTQWRAVTDKPYNTIAASFDIKSKKHWIKIKNATSKFRKSDESGFGWGVNFFNDKAGDGKMGTLQANGSLAYQIYLSGKSMLALGFQGGILQRSIDVTNFHWGTQYDPTSSTGYTTSPALADKAIANVNSSFIRGDGSTGLVYAYKKSESRISGNDQLDIIVGASMFHLFTPKYSFLGENEKLSQRIVFHGNAVIGINNTNIAIVPGYMVSMQGSNREIFAGGMIRYMLQQNSIVTGFVKGAYLYAGGYYRNKDAFVATALFEFSSFGVGMSYDFNISGLKTVSSGRGGLEITLRFLNPAPFLYSQASFKK